MKKTYDILFPNFRDIGGFRTTSSKIGRTGFFYRSAMPKQLGEEEYKFLNSKGIRTIVDFRCDKEKRNWDFKVDSNIKYITLPYYDEIAVEYIKEMEANDTLEWSKVYIRVLEDGAKWIRDVFVAFALSKDAILFHCASGKDRTGIIAALLLDLLGAERIWIYTDYTQSQYNLSSEKNAFYRTNPNSIKAFLNFVHNKYGSSKAYLRLIGVPDCFLSIIKNKMLEN